MKMRLQATYERHYLVEVLQNWDLTRMTVNY